ELFQLPKQQDRATRLLTYIADIIVNGHPQIAKKPAAVPREPAPVPVFPLPGPGRGKGEGKITTGTRDKFHELGAEKFTRWVLDQERLLITDTTFRDAHQSLLATRMR